MPPAIIFLRYLIQLLKVKNFNRDWNIFNMVYKDSKSIYELSTSSQLMIGRCFFFNLLSIGKKNWLNMSLTLFSQTLFNPSQLLLFHSLLDFYLTPFCRMFAVLWLLLKTRMSSRDGIL